MKTLLLNIFAVSIAWSASPKTTKPMARLPTQTARPAVMSPPRAAAPVSPTQFPKPPPPVPPVPAPASPSSNSKPFTGPKTVESSKFGEKMIVEVQTLNTDKTILVAFEKTTGKDGKEFNKQLYVINVNLKKDELLSSTAGFRCESPDNAFVYGVVAKATAKESGAFAPVKAWKVDDKNMKLVFVPDIAKVTCRWAPQGDTRYPFK